MQFSKQRTQSLQRYRGLISAWAGRDGVNAIAGAADHFFRRAHLGHIDFADMYAVIAAQNVRRLYAGAATPQATQA